MTTTFTLFLIIVLTVNTVLFSVSDQNIHAKIVVFCMWVVLMTELIKDIYGL